MGGGVAKFKFRSNLRQYGQILKIRKQQYWETICPKCLWLSGYAKCNVSASTYIL